MGKQHSDITVTVFCDRYAHAIRSGWTAQQLADDLLITRSQLYQMKFRFTNQYKIAFPNLERFTVSQKQINYLQSLLSQAQNEKTTSR
jgi:hypothetical protein